MDIEDYIGKYVVAVFESGNKRYVVEARLEKQTTDSFVFADGYFTEYEKLAKGEYSEIDRFSGEKIELNKEGLTSVIEKEGDHDPVPC